MSREDSLTPEQFEALLAVFHPNREEAGKIYEGVRRRLVYVLERRGCTCPEELADETFNRVARKLAEGLALEKGDPYAYISGVARHVFQEWLRRRRREETAVESGDRQGFREDEEVPDFRIEHLRHCLRKLGNSSSKLLLRYYEPERRIASRKDLCIEMEIEMNALRIRVHRLRKKVEICLKERLKS